MKQWMILASAAVLAVGSVGCANSNSNPASPSSSSALAAEARGGNGGGKGKPGGTTSGSSGSLALQMVDDVNNNGSPDWADTITFNVTSTASSPFVRVDCYQGSSWVYYASVGYFEAYPWPKQFILSNTSWTGGAAACKATLYTTLDGTSSTTLATLDFNVGS